MTIIERLLEKLFGLDSVHCESCIHLRSVLEQEMMRSERMVETLARAGVTNPTPSRMPEDYKPLPSKYTPWSVVKNQLEAKDRTLAEQRRKEAQILLERQKDAARIAKLEKELDIPEEGQNEAASNESSSAEQAS